MRPDDFVRSYERALATRDWRAVDPLVHADACVTFSTGEVHEGKPAVRAAFERNFAAIRDESYRVTNVHWVFRSEETAVYLFDFHWAGVVGGRPVSGSGRGTSVLVFGRERWQLLVEHLGPGADG